MLRIYIYFSVFRVLNLGPGVMFFHSKYPHGYIDHVFCVSLHSPIPSLYMRPSSRYVGPETY